MGYKMEQPGGFQQPSCADDFEDPFGLAFLESLEQNPRKLFPALT